MNPVSLRFGSLTALEQRRAASKTYEIKQQQDALDAALNKLTDDQFLGKVAIPGVSDAVPAISYRELLKAAYELLLKNAREIRDPNAGLPYGDLADYFAGNKKTEREFDKAMKVLRGRNLVTFGWLWRKIHITQLGKAALESAAKPAPSSPPPNA